MNVHKTPEEIEQDEGMPTPAQSAAYLLMVLVFGAVIAIGVFGGRIAIAPGW